jgi:phage repressor protein C with HTH and peptisase S24 domain
VAVQPEIIFTANIKARTKNRGSIGQHRQKRWQFITQRGLGGLRVNGAIKTMHHDGRLLYGYLWLRGKYSYCILACIHLGYLKNSLCQFALQKNLAIPIDKVYTLLMKQNLILKKHRIVKGYSLQTLADKVGTTKSQIDKLEKGERRLTVDWLQRLANALGVEPAHLFHEDGGSPPPVAPALPSLPEAKPTVEPLLLYGRPRGLEDALHDMHVATGSMERPPWLQGASDAYAVYTIGEAMQPRYYAGEVLFVAPSLPVIPYCYVVIIGYDQRAIVRQYIAKEGQKLVVQEHNPQKQSRIALADVKHIHRISGSKDTFA